MPAKTVPLSVRVSPDDAEFIARMRIDEATTPSEKLRALLRAERRRREGYHDYRRVLGLTRETLGPAVERLQTAEAELGIHSELCHLVADWVPDLFATLLTGLADVPEDERPAALADLEQALADRVFRLTEAVLRLGVTREVRGCDPEVVQKRIAPLLDLIEVIRSTR